MVHSNRIAMAAAGASSVGRVGPRAKPVACGRLCRCAGAGPRRAVKAAPVVASPFARALGNETRSLAAALGGLRGKTSPAGRCGSAAQGDTVGSPSLSLDLNDVRDSLIRMEDSIIFAIIGKPQQQQQQQQPPPLPWREGEPACARLSLGFRGLSMPQRPLARTHLTDPPTHGFSSFHTPLLTLCQSGRSF